MKKKDIRQDAVNALEEKKEGFVSLKVDYAFTYVMKNLRYCGVLSVHDWKRIK